MGKANLFLLSIVLMASLTSLSHGLILNGLQIGTVSVQGTLHCTVTGSLTAPPVSGSTVFLKCAGSSANLGQAVTNLAGTFNIVAKILETTLFTPSSCRVYVKLPVITCNVYPPDGVVSAGVSLVGVVQNNAGNIANFVTGPFITGIF